MCKLPRLVLNLGPPGSVSWVAGVTSLWNCTRLFVYWSSVSPSGEVIITFWKEPKSELQGTDSSKQEPGVLIMAPKRNIVGSCLSVELSLGVDCDSLGLRDHHHAAQLRILCSLALCLRIPLPLFVILSILASRFASRAHHRVWSQIPWSSPRALLTRRSLTVTPCQGTGPLWVPGFPELRWVCDFLGSGR